LHRLLETGEQAVANLGDALEAPFALSLHCLFLEGFGLLARLLDDIDDLTLALPLEGHGALLLGEAGELLLEGGEALSTGIITLLAQGLALHR
jgi:hypothetical protein